MRIIDFLDKQYRVRRIEGIGDNDSPITRHKQATPNSKNVCPRRNGIITESAKDFVFQ